MIIGKRILSFCIMAIEAWGSVYFFDIFMERKRTGWVDKCRYIVLYPACVALALLGANIDSMGIKALLVVWACIVFCMAFYRSDWKQCIFFPVLNYSLLFLMDLFSLQVENILIAKDEAYMSKLAFLALPTKLLWILLLIMLRRIWKGKSSYGELSNKEWWKFGMVPLFTVASMLPISESSKDEMFELTKKEFLRENGVLNGDTTKRRDVYDNLYRQTKKDDRLAAGYTMEQYERTYRRAFLDAARKADSSWEIGKPIPSGALDGITRESVEANLKKSGSSLDIQV